MSTQHQATDKTSAQEVSRLQMNRAGRVREKTLLICFLQEPPTSSWYQTQLWAKEAFSLTQQNEFYNLLGYNLIFTLLIVLQFFFWQKRYQLPFGITQVLLDVRAGRDSLATSNKQPCCTCTDPSEVFSMSWMLLVTQRFIDEHLLLHTNIP